MSALGRPTRHADGSAVAFVLLVFVLSVPFWALGQVTGARPLPGLPVSSLAVLCPLAAAAILTYRERGVEGVGRLLSRSGDWARIPNPTWYLPTLLLMPAIAAAGYGVMRLAGRSLPGWEPPLSTVPALALGFLVAAFGEELGWSGYATDRMRRRWSALGVGIVLGIVWAAWHVVLLLQAGRAPSWIAWQCVNLVATRVLLVWLYEGTGRSVLAVALCHATSNLAWQLFPNQGSHYDPRVIGPITALAAATVTLVWGRDLASARILPRR